MRRLFHEPDLWYGFMYFCSLLACLRPGSATPEIHPRSSRPAGAKEFASKLDARLKLGSVGITTKAGVKIEVYAEKWLQRIQCTR